MTETINALRNVETPHTGEDHSEGPLAKKMEAQTAKVPSDLWLWAAGAAMCTSLVFKIAGKKDSSQFVGQWAAPLLLAGVYNKIVKVAGSDSRTGPR